MPFGLGLPEVAIIVGLLVLLFGGPKIAELGKGVGQAITGFRHAIKEDDDEEEGKA